MPEKKADRLNYKKFSFFIVLGIIGLILFRYLLVVNNWGPKKSLLVAGITGVFYFIFVYYLAYKYFFPEFREKRTASWINNLILNFLAGIAATYWFPMTNSHTQFLIDGINKFFINSSFSIFPLVSNKWYYHYFFQIELALILGLVFIIISQFLNKSLETKKGMTLEKINSIFFYFIVFLYLSGVFATGFQYDFPNEKSNWFFGGTEEMITNRLTDETSFWEDIQLNGGFNYYYLYETTGDKFLYKSATGFYGSVFKLIQTTSHISPDLFIKIYRVISALLVTFIFTLLVHKTRKMFGVLAALFITMMISVTWWIVGPAKHFVWVSYIFYLPFILPWFIYPNVIKGKISFKFFCVVIFGLEILMFLRGYSYIGNIILAPTIAVLFYELQNKSQITQIIKRIFLIGICGISAFLIVMGLHFAQLALFEQSGTKALNFILNRAETRIAGEELQSNYVTGSYSEVFNVWIKQVHVFVKPLTDLLKFNVFGYEINLNNFLTIHIFYFLIQITSLVTFLLRWIKLRGKEKVTIGEDKLLSLSLACGWAMICSWTWFPARNHMANHDHMNGIMYFLPFGLTLMMLGGGFFEIMIRKIVSPGNFNNQNHENRIC